MDLGECNRVSLRLRMASTTTSQNGCRAACDKACQFAHAAHVAVLGGLEKGFELHGRWIARFPWLAIIIGLGHENAGVFSNDENFAKAFLKAADTEGEGAWQMPLGKAYADQLKSRIADVKNVGGRAAGSITAAEFLHRFVQDGTPWIHLDIAGVASTKTDTKYAPKGASGWGVLALNRLVADRFEVSE